MFARRGDVIGESNVREELEAYIESCGKKYLSDLRTLLVYITEGFDNVGGAYIYRTLKNRYPGEYKDLKEVIRKALLVAEDPEIYGFIPKGYILDRWSDPDVLVLRRDDPDRTFVAVFSASGVTVQGILAAVREDRGRTL